MDGRKRGGARGSKWDTAALLSTQLLIFQLGGQGDLLYGICHLTRRKAILEFFVSRIFITFTLCVCVPVCVHMPRHVCGG